MKANTDNFNVLASIEKHIEALKPLMPKRAVVCVGEYPIKIFLKNIENNMEGTLPIFIEKSTDEIYKWLPKEFKPYFMYGFEDEKIDTHFWYDVLPTITKDHSITESLKKKPTEKMRSAIIFSSVWDGVGSAVLPALIKKFRASTMDSLSIAVLPSKIQANDAHFNAYATLQLCSATEGSTVLLMDRDGLESFEGVDREGKIIKGNIVANYILRMFLEKEALVEEISELSRTFSTKMFTPLLITGASYKIYGSLENILNATLLKPFLTFNLSSATLLYVVLRMPNNLKDTLPRSKIELSITNWFKEKTSLKSIHISEPTYTEDMTDRIDAVLFLGGFDTIEMFAKLDKKVSDIKTAAVEKGLMTEDWQLPFKIEEEPKSTEAPALSELNMSLEETIQTPTQPPIIEEVKPAEIPAATPTETVEITAIPNIEENAPESTLVQASSQVEAVEIESSTEKSKRTRKPRKSKTARKLKAKLAEKAEATKKPRTRRNRNTPQ